MTMNKFAILSVCVACACGAWAQDLIKYNQVGYYPDQEKEIIVEAKAGKAFRLIGPDGATIAEGKSTDTRQSPFNDKKRSLIDLTEITTPGTYTLTVGDQEVPIIVTEHALSALADAGLKAFYYQRTAMTIDEKYAGKWHRPAAHFDDQVMVHPSAASEMRPAGSIISSPKGWYDAGDYNKYIVNSSFSIALMLNAYQENKDYFNQQSVNIPESGREMPDILSEIKYNLDWMLTMQDPNDGGLYHKLTTPNFEGFVMPTECHQQRYVVAKSTAATLDFAAVMIQAAEVYAPYCPDYAHTLLTAAKRAWQWAEENPNVIYDQDAMSQKYEPAIYTGTYGDTELGDEWFWAASNMYLGTRDEGYLGKVKAYQPKHFMLPTWGNVAGLGYTSWAFAKDLKGSEATMQQEMRQSIINYADSVSAAADNGAFHTPYGNREEDFFWGCNCEGLATQGIYLMQAYQLAKESSDMAEAQKFLIAAHRDADYLLGRNATGYCYVTGFGTKSTLHPHHRLSSADGIDEPLPGFLAGGPNPGRQDGEYVQYPSTSPDECYADVEGSYASNEIAINWNASLVAFISALDAASK